MAFQLNPLMPLDSYSTPEERDADIERYRKDIELLDKDNREDDDQTTEPLPRCRRGEIAWFASWTEALAEGHIYSEAGLREFGISGLCEYHFDKITKGLDE